MVRESGYWKDLGNARREAEKAIESEGWVTLPSEHILRKTGYIALGTSIDKYHGGIVNFRKLIGKRKLEIKFKDFDSAKAEAQRIMQEEGWSTLPGRPSLNKAGYGTFANAIYSHHGGLPTFRRSLGQKQLMKPKGVWKSLDYTVNRFKEAMEAEGWEELPGQSLLIDRGYQSIVNAANHYHGGYEALLGILEKSGIKRNKNGRKPVGYWDKLENVKSEMSMLVQQLGHFPTHDEVLDVAGFGLADGISRQGGIHSVSEKMGYESKTKPKGYWHEFNNVEIELKRVIRQLGHFPTQQELKSLQMSGLGRAIQTYGGLVAVRRRLEEGVKVPFGKKGLEKVLRDYAAKVD